MNNNDFEKSRQELLRNIGTNQIKSRDDVNKEKMWKYEILKYRKQKRKEKFFAIGALAGIISLVMNLILNFDIIKNYIYKLL